MKKIILAMICAVASLGALAQDSKLTVNAGFLFPSTLNSTCLLYTSDAADD